MGKLCRELDGDLVVSRKVVRSEALGKGGSTRWRVLPVGTRRLAIVAWAGFAKSFANVSMLNLMASTTTIRVVPSCTTSKLLGSRRYSGLMTESERGPEACHSREARISPVRWKAGQAKKRDLHGRVNHDFRLVAETEIGAGGLAQPRTRKPAGDFEPPPLPAVARRP